MSVHRPTTWNSAPSHRPLEIAVVGGGIAGLGAAWLLSQRHRVTLYEQERRLGGHSNTVMVRAGDAAIPVDTGFIVYNEPNYPNLTRLFAHLGVATEPSDMSFSVSVDRGRLEYSGGAWLGLFAQPSNLLRVEHWRMLRDIARFFRSAPAMLDEHGPSPTLGQFLTGAGFSRGFLYDHLLPMGAAIWSVPVRTMLDFPARSFVRFLHNHGLLRMTGRPQWRTVSGGSRQYIERLARATDAAARLGAKVVAVRRGPGGVIVTDATGGHRRFDHAVIATHADQALALLTATTPDERRVLSAFTYQRNIAVLHRDARLMPRRRRAWASWNYLAERDGAVMEDAMQLSVTYWMNRLQNIDMAHPLFVSLNPIRAPHEALTEAAFEYDHPAFDQAALDAQVELAVLQGRQRAWFCGSYCGFGFHEDALTSGLAVAEMLGCRRPWADAPAPRRGAGAYLPERAAAGPGR